MKAILMLIVCVAGIGANFKSAHTEINNFGQNSGQVENKKSIPEPDTHWAIIESVPRPELPQDSSERPLVKKVTVRMVLGADGRVTDIRVLEILPEWLSDEIVGEWKENCIKAVKQIQFLPAKKDGRIVSEWLKVEYIFQEDGIRVFMTTEA